MNPIDIHYAAMRERRYQREQWGTADQNPHSVGDWLLIIEGELDEAKQGWRKGKGDADALCEVLQVLASCYACIEEHRIVEREQQ